jgi:uncharacterized protein DUF4837
MNIFKIKFALIIVLSSFFSCSEDMLNERLLVDAEGKPGELFVVMDSIQWKGELGEVIKSVIKSNVPGLPQGEPYFKVHYIEPTKFKSFLRNVKNILFVATLDSKTQGGAIVRNYITREYIEDNPNIYRVSQKDVYAKGQTVLYLFGANQEELTQQIVENESFVRDFFNSVEKQRLLSNLYKAKEKKGINKTLLKNHGFHMRVPNGYRLEDNIPGFVWLRSPGIADGTIDKNIFVTSKPYQSESSFAKGEIIAWRNEITKKKIYEDPDMPSSYMETDTINVNVAYNTVELGGNYAKEIKGIWKTHNLSIGGSYISYVVLDKESNQLFYLDGFVVSPGKPKRETMRELETILSTFRTKSQKEGTEK